MSGSRMARRIVLGIAAWTLALTAAHFALNVNWSSVLNDRLPFAQRKLNVAYIPVTCHLTCPVTDFISRYSLDGNIFIPRMFQGFPEIKEALLSDRMQVGFMVAPMAIALRSQGDPVLFLSDPPGVNDNTRRDMLDALSQLNQHQYEAIGDPEITLFRRQTAEQLGAEITVE